MSLIYVNSKQVVLVGVKHQVNLGSWLCQALQQYLVSACWLLVLCIASFSKEEGSLMGLQNCRPDGKCK